MKQLSVFDNTSLSNENLSIKLIREFEAVSLARNPLGYVVGYSGGKDSEVLVDLFIRSGVKFIVMHNHTGLDAPETVYHIRNQFKKWQEMGIDCRIYYPKKTFWQICKEKKMLPTRTVRFCCEELKERTDIPELKFATRAFGVRKTESTKRAQHRDSIETRNTESYGTKSHQMFHFDKAEEVKQTSACYTNKYFIVNPIAYWTDNNIWEYIKERELNYNPLYDMGFKRVGCIGCPMAKHRKEEFKRYPKYEALYKKLADELIKQNSAIDVNYFNLWTGG